MGVSSVSKLTRSQVGGAVKALDIVADKKAAQGQLSICHPSDNGKHVDDRQMPQKMIGRVIENVAYRIFNAAHNALHPVHCSRIMAAVYPLAAVGAHQMFLL
jgi:hypothetical protein